MLTYNRERFVGRMIECVLSQTFRDFEFIIVDNGSTDRSGAVAEAYAGKDGRIRVFRRERGNIGSGRNLGLDAARGEFVAFVDDDDLCEPDFLEFLYALAADNRADVAVCGTTGVHEDAKRVYSAEEAVIELLWRKRFNVQFPTKLIRRELFEHMRFSESAKYDDIELMPKILASADKVAYRGLPKYTLERHGGNHSAWTSDHSLLDAETLSEYLAVYGERTLWLCERFPENKALWRYFNWSFMISMVEKISRYKLSDCMRLREKMILELQSVKTEFMNARCAREFEKEWMNAYVRTE
jgi:glycosyltransferase involved in cell wall biosynthesis